MAIEIYIAIALLTAGASYMQAKKAQKKAKELTEGVEANIESNSKEIPVVYGKRRVGGTRVYIDTSRDKKHQYLYMVLAMAEGEVESITDIKIDDVSIDDARFNYDGNLSDRNLEFEVFLGSDDQAASTMIGDGTSYDYDRLGEIYNDPFADQHERDAADPNRVLPWSSKHRLRGIAYLALKFKWDENAYNGIPDVTAVVKGRKVYDPRNGTTAWSDNPALCIRDYLTNERFGKGLPASAIDDVAFIKAANDLDGFIAYPYQDSPSYQYLFRMNHVVDTSKKIMENLNDMIVACRGFIPYSNGVYSLKIDQTSSSVLSINADQIISGIGIAGARKEDRFNQVKVNFFNASSNYKEDQAIYPEENSTLYQQYLAEDEGEPLVDEVNLYSIDNYYSAREMARLFLERSRQNMTIGFQGTSELINLEVGEVVSITHPTPAWTNKLFQVQEVALAFDGTVQITCIEYDASLYTYDTPDEEQAYVGTRLPDPNQVDPPTELNTTTGTYIEQDGKAIGYIDLSWTAPEDSLVDRYELKFEYSSREEVIELASTEYRFKPTQDNVSYVISVRAVNGLGIRSAWLTAAAVTAVADTTAPSDITGITATGGLQSITLDWTNPTEDDFDLVRIKHNTVDEEPSSHSFEVRSDSFVHDIGAYSTTKHYWLAPVDRTGNVGSYVSAGSETTGSIDYSDVGNTPTIPVIPEIATTVYLTLSDSDAPTDVEFNTAVGRDPIENDFVVVSYTVETVTNTKAYVYKTVSPAEVPDWTEVTEYIDGSMIVTGSLSASDITTGTLNANDVTISNLTIGYGSVTDTPTIPSAVSELTNDTGFVTSVAWNELTGTAPAVSTFNNDSSFITSDDVPSNPQWWSLSGRDDTTAPTDADFNTAFSRNPVKGDVLLITDTGGDTANYQYSGTAWTSITALIRGDMLVQGTVNADRIEVDGTSASVTIDGDTGTPILVQSDGSTVFSVSDLGDVTMNGAYISGIPVTAIPTFESDVRAVVGAVVVDALVPATPVSYTEQDFPTNLLSSLKILDTGQSAYASDYSYSLVLRIDDSWTYEYTSEDDKQGGQDLYYSIEGYNSVTDVWETVLAEKTYTTPVFYKFPRGGNPQELYVIDITETVANIPSYYTGFRGWFRGVDKSQDHFANFEFEPYMTVKSGSSGFIPEDISVTSGTATGGGSLTYDNQGQFTFSPADVSSFVTQTDINNSISSLVDSAPATLDTLNELAAALGDDANFSITVTNSIATKASKAGDTFTGTVRSTKSTIGSIGGNATMANAGFLAGSTSNGVGIDGNEIVKVGGDKFYINQISNEPIEFHLGVSSSNAKRLSITTSGISVSGTITATGYNNSNWDTAYGWGDHSTQGYLTSETNDYVDSMTFSTSNGTLRLGRTGSLSDLVVDLDGRYQLDTAPSTPSITSTSVVNETIEVVFSQSSTSGIEYYEVWSDGGVGSYSLIAKITEQDFASSMSVVDVTFSAGTVNYRVFAVKNGIYSTASTTSRAFTAPSLDVANLQVVPDLNVFHIGYNIPDSRFVDHVEIYADANASSSSLSRSNATIVYSGNGESFIYNISPAERDMFHQFWVEVV